MLQMGASFAERRPRGGCRSPEALLVGERGFVRSSGEKCRGGVGEREREREAQGVDV